MRKLLCLLSTALLLLACNDVDEFGQMLPDSVTLGEIRPVSELTYDELETLVPDEYQREEMRRNGGLLVQAQVNTSSSYQTYDYMEVYYSDNQSSLPGQSGGSGNWTELTGSTGSYDDAGWAYISWYGDAQMQLPGKTIYCKASLSLYGGNQMPGFVEHIRDDYYGSSYLYSEVRSYEYPDAPLISEFEVYGGDVIQANFRTAVDEYSVSEMPERGICYSTSNALPTISDGVTYVPSGYGQSSYASVTAQVPGGTYYVRAFVMGENGDVAYSPVQRVSSQGLMFSTKIDSVVYVNNLKYSDLPKYLPMATEDQIQTLRGVGGYLIYASSRIEENGLYPEFGFTAFPNKNYVQDTEGYGDIPFCSKNDGSSFVYNLALGTFIDYPTDYFFSISFRVHTFGKVAQSGICYSTTNELPTLEHNDGILEHPNVSEGTFDSNIEFNDILLPAGNYYFRIYSQTEDGVGYSPVMQTTIRSN